ncbi:type 1 glutamine amidotransferase [Bacteroidota bacterium]
MNQENIKIAVLDMYDNETNQGMRCIKDILGESNAYFENIDVHFEIFETRYKAKVPDNNYDIYISSGGPGDPFDGIGKKWEKDYFTLLDKIWDNNQQVGTTKKYLFFICHSFQIMARYFKLGEVIKRKSKSFGVLPVHITEEGKDDIILKGLSDPFYGADFRGWQVIQPNEKIMDDLGAKVICLEKVRPHVELERAMMAVRVSNEIIGTQFHPEADPESMHYHFKRPERKKQVVDEYGEKKYYEMIEILEEPDNITLTRNTVLPNFLRDAISNLKFVENLV